MSDDAKPAGDTPTPAPAEVTETARKVEETTKTTKPAEGVQKSHAPARPQA